MHRRWIVTFALAASLWGFGGASCSSESGDEQSGTGGDGGSHGDGSNSAGATAPETLAEFCGVLGSFFCDRCFPEDPSCVSTQTTDCSENASARDPGGYTKAKGQACLDALANVDCENPPLNCQAELAVAECNLYLDAQTDGVDPACP
jgi:hypothetical protein